MSIIDASRKFVSELVGLVGKRIHVVLVDGKRYEGVLLGFDHPTMNLLLENAVDDKGNRYPKIIIKGDRVSELVLLEVPLFDPEEFRSLLLRELGIPEHLVKVIPEARVVDVQGRYRVSERGVEGTGPLAETLYAFYEKYIEAKRKALKG
ncbi:MAG: Lsm family RNA-binding protein [Desulfurococcaceae archaeon]